MAFDNRLTDTNQDWRHNVTERTIKLVNYFAMDTVDNILRHIDRLHIKDTGQLRSSIKAIVHTNAGGDNMLVQIFNEYYAGYVENAVGKYWGVDADLGKKRGVRVGNVQIPQIPSRDYGPLTPTFVGIPTTGHHAELRTRTHKARPFINAEIKRQIKRISLRMMSEVGRNMEIHVLDVLDATMESAITQALTENVTAALLAPYGGSPRKQKIYFPDINRLNKKKH